LRDTVPLEEVQLESDLTYEEKPSRYWKQEKGIHAPKPSSSARCSGVTTLRKNLLGNVKTIFKKITLTYLRASFILRGLVCNIPSF
jgi:hypothetical protein